MGIQLQIGGSNDAEKDTEKDTEKQAKSENINIRVCFITYANKIYKIK